MVGVRASSRVEMSSNVIAHAGSGATFVFFLSRPQRSVKRVIIVSFRFWSISCESRRSIFVSSSRARLTGVVSIVSRHSAFLMNLRS